MRSFPCEITLSLAVADSGTVTPAQALNWANVTIDEGARLEIDRKRLHEDNESFDANVRMNGDDEVIHFTRTGPAEGKLAIVIYISY